jgi:hypothetical protein
VKQEGEEDDVTMADVRSKLFDTTSRLARCTSLLQVRVRVRVRCACAIAYVHLLVVSLCFSCL